MNTLFAIGSVERLLAIIVAVNSTTALILFAICWINKRVSRESKPTSESGFVHRPPKGDSYARSRMRAGIHGTSGPDFKSIDGDRKARSTTIRKAA